MKNIYNLMTEIDLLLEEVESINSEIYENMCIIQNLEKQIKEEETF